jgi:transcriptional regulator with XRE-family HTH domain
VQFVANNINTLHSGAKPIERQPCVLTTNTTAMVDKMQASRSAELDGTSELPARLGRNLAVRRKALGLTQADVAERLGVDTETLSRFERGKHVPSLLTLERLADTLGSTCADLLGQTPPVPSSDALMMETWLSGLKKKDAAFALRIFKACCDHLAGR